MRQLKVFFMNVLSVLLCSLMQIGHAEILHTPSPVDANKWFHQTTLPNGHSWHNQEQQQTVFDTKPPFKPPYDGYNFDNVNAKQLTDFCQRDVSQDPVMQTLEDSMDNAKAIKANQDYNEAHMGQDVEAGRLAAEISSGNDEYIKTVAESGAEAEAIDEPGQRRQIYIAHHDARKGQVDPALVQFLHQQHQYQHRCRDLDDRPETERAAADVLDDDEHR